MFAMHMRQCQDYAQWNSDNMVDTALMVVLSIQQRWDNVGKQLEVTRKMRSQSPYLWGFKAETYEFLRTHKRELYAETMSLQNRVDRLDLWASVPGFGLVKGGFMVQLMHGDMGCIDSHNMKLYDIGRAQLRLDPHLTTKTRRIKLENYINLCDMIGGAEYLWRRWCVHMADMYPDTYDDQYDVSARHIEYLRGDV